MTEFARKNWNKLAGDAIKAKMYEHGIGFIQLSELFLEQGESETANAICNKVNRGTFSHAFYLKCMELMAKQEKQEDREKKYKIISLFSGCGGMDLGFLGGFEFLNRTYDKHDFDIIWANEIDEHAVRTYRHNLGNHIVHGDIWQHLDEIPTSADIIIGGFPCQDISINGKGAGISGSRSGLYKAMLSAVERVRPKIFVAENVKGLLMKHHRKDLETVLSDFRNLGYQVDYYLLNAADYGVPQTRERVIIVGRLPEIPEIQIEKTNTSNSYVTARQAIGDLVDKVEDEIANHIWSRAEKSPDQGSRKLDAERAGYTIRAECHGNIQWHYELPRRISMREAARIQSFPDNFIFQAKLRATERQIGNAVPPVLGWHIAAAVSKALK
ncbi:putative modification methylase (cytosine-specific methyltransferase) [Neisseria meningitidis]|nr:putative modification methylase (cytosine-specific methyltransferase) [Neisseria meningitidis]